MSTTQPAPFPESAEQTGSPAADGIRRWLEASAVSLRAREAMVVVRQGERGFIFASYPESDTPNDVLTSVAHRAIGEGLNLSRRRVDDEVTVVVGLRSRIGGRPAALVFELPEDSDRSDDVLISQVRRAALRRDEDAVDTFQPLPMGLPTAALSPRLDPLSPQASVRAHSADIDDTLRRKVERQGAALGAVTEMLDQPDAAQAMQSLVEVLARRFACCRVALGVQKRRRIQIEAVSGSAHSTPSSDEHINAALALEETIHQSRLIAAPALNTGQVVPPNHRAYLHACGSGAVVSVPLLKDDRVFGALLLEREQPFDDSEVEDLTGLALLAAPLVALNREASAGLGSRLRRSLERLARAVFGRQRAGAKLALCLLLAVAVGLTQITRTHSITANAAIEADVQRAVVASSRGFISQVEKRAGDVVFQGDVLARLDVEELQIDLIRWRGERDKLSKEQRAVMAQRDRARVRVLNAQLAQAQAQVEFLETRIAKAVMRSPIDGVVVSGDLSDALGSPVERGQLLFEVASLDDYRLVLRVDESDIGSLEEGQTGFLRLKSLPQTTFEFTVDTITPVAEAGNGVNQFRLEATMTAAPSELRPGMEGVARISAGERSVAWIWTRSFVEWARLQLWRWGGV